MDNTFLQLISLLIQLTNQVAALQAELAALKTQETAEVPTSASPQ